MAEYIERTAAIEALAALGRQMFNLGDSYPFYLEGLKDADIRIRALPSANVRPVDEATWTETRIVLGAPESVYLCSACFRAAFRTSDYCPNCGAKMKRGGDGNG